MIFQYDKTNGFNAKDYNEIIDYIRECPNAEYRVEIKKKRKLRTPPQNRLYWLVLNWFRIETGNEKEDMHELFRKKFNMKLRKVTINGKTYIVELPGSTTVMDTKEFSEYYNKVENWFCEQGYTPPPIEDLEKLEN